jgi:uncharacterized membrane protein YedE/YeeE
LPLPATDFTPWAALFGGLLIGLSAVLTILLFGRIAGIIGILARALGPVAVPWSDRVWRIAFLVGLLVAPLVVAVSGPIEQTVSSNLPMMVLAGLLVGLGTALGFGCTSGHGVCGLARLSRRSLVSVGVFMAMAVATVLVLRHLVGAV